jgi:hypothetical protein
LADKTINSIVFSMLSFKRIIVRIFFWCVLGVSLCEFILSLAFRTTDEIVHLSNGLIVKQFIFLVADNASYLLGIHLYLAGWVETSQISTTIDKL